MDLRPLHHISPIKGWINDPNGVIKFKNKYHVFYQHHPYGLTWGPMHWGHVVSDDLLHWEHLPIALTPGDTFDKDGCFSGTAIVHNNRLYLVYTGFIFNEDNEKIIQQQCLAYSDDGVNFTKVGLIIGKDNLPKEFAPNDFRDPMVYQDNDGFIMLVCARKIGGKGNILKYKSQDLIHWEYVSYILNEDSRGIMTECVDYVKDLHLLINSEQYRPYIGYNDRNAHTTIYRVGEFKNDKFIFNHEGMIDYGFDFYAPQVILKDNIMIGWMNMWERNNPSEKYGFAGSLTIPRKIKVINDELYQTPVLPRGKKEKHSIKDRYIDHTRVGFYRILIDNLESFDLKVRKGQSHETIFKLENNEWIFDRLHAGEQITGCEKDEDSLKQIRRMPYLKKDHHDIYLVLDEFSFEIFVDGKSLTSLIYPDLEDDLLDLQVNAQSVVLYKYLNE